MVLKKTPWNISMNIRNLNSNLREPEKSDSKLANNHRAQLGYIYENTECVYFTQNWATISIGINIRSSASQVMGGKRRTAVCLYFPIHITPEGFCSVEGIIKIFLRFIISGCSAGLCPCPGFTNPGFATSLPRIYKSLRWRPASPARRACLVGKAGKAGSKNHENQRFFIFRDTPKGFPSYGSEETHGRASLLPNS